MMSFRRPQSRHFSILINAIVNNVKFGVTKIGYSTSFLASRNGVVCASLNDVNADGMGGPGCKV